MHLSSGVYKITLSTGGSGYTSTPAVTISGGGGTGAQAVAQTTGNTTAGYSVGGIVITNAGSGYTSAPTVTIDGNAAATASVLAFGTTRVLCMFQGRFNDMYGVNGLGRGFRWDGDTPTIEAIGISPPASAPVITAATTPASYYISNIQMVRSGNGYSSVPSVVINGGSATTAAVVRAAIRDGRVSGVTLVNRGQGYVSAPTVAFAGGIASGEAFTVNCLAKLAEVQLTTGGSGYTEPPTVSFSTTNGLTGAHVVAYIANGRVSGLDILASGDGATGTVGLTITGGGGTGAQGVAFLEHRVTSVSVANSGTGHLTPPVITVFPDKTNSTVFDVAQLTCSVSNGGVEAVTVLSGGGYAAKPTASVRDTTAKATASIAPVLKGKYRCAIRYVDDTVESRGGPIPSSISTLTDVDVESGAASFSWTWTNAGAEARAHKIELWRTTADQSVVLYRVAVLSKSNGALPTSYSGDNLADHQLLDPTRTDYGLMPVVLPTGQINARRFNPPPENMAVACLFQDRAWYAVDTSGAKPNSLLFSEIDEPESVPSDNELIVQENTGEPDAIVALVPLGAALLIIQSRHLYKLQYVSQPVIDASIMLGAHRGILGSRCWALMGGVCFIVDSNGMYAYDGNGEEAVSVPVDNYWRDGIIDFSKSKHFYVQSDTASRVVKFFYCKATDGSYPSRALCYCAATKAWWEEEYAQSMPSGTVATIGSAQRPISGTQAGGFVKASGLTDVTAAGSTSPVSYRFRSHPAAVVDEPDRGVGILYRPTATTSDLNVALHYNNSTSPRANAISSDRGNGFVTTVGGTSATLDMRLARSALGDSRGYAKAYYAGRLDDRSAGADRHIAVDLSGQQAGTSPDDAVVLYGLTIGGVK